MVWIVIVATTDTKRRFGYQVRIEFVAVVVEIVHERQFLYFKGITGIGLHVALYYDICVSALIKTFASGTRKLEEGEAGHSWMSLR